MAKARGTRPRTLAFVFGTYFLLAIVVAFFLSGPVSVYVDPGATSWIGAAYVVSGALVLVGVCLGALARWTRLDARLAGLEDMQREAVEAQAPEASLSRPEESAPSATPTDQDVDQLLTDLEKIGEAAGAEVGSVEESLGDLRLALPATAGLRGVGQRELERVSLARDAVASYATGPAIASLGLLGVFAALLPASDGMLLGNLQLNAFLEFAGLAWLVGLVVYAAVAFRQIGRRAL